MTKNPKKRIKILIFITVFAFVVLFVMTALLFVLTKHGVENIRDFRVSLLAPNKPSNMIMFIDKGFKELQIGMSEEDVLYKLGNPLGKATSASWDIWCYGIEEIEGLPREHFIFDLDVTDNRILYFFQGKLAEIEMTPQGAHSWPKHYSINNNRLYSPAPILGMRTSYGYAIAYSEERFKKVQKGMTRQQVIDLLGRPMAVWKETTGIENWVYGYGSGSQGRKIVVRFVYFIDNQVSKIEKSDQVDW